MWELAMKVDKDVKVVIITTLNDVYLGTETIVKNSNNKK